MCRIEEEDKAAKTLLLVLPEVYLYTTKDRQKRDALKRAGKSRRKRKRILLYVGIPLAILALFTLPRIIKEVAKYRFEREVQSRDPDAGLYTSTPRKR